MAWLDYEHAGQAGVHFHWLVLMELTECAGVQTDYAEAVALHPVEDRHHWMVLVGDRELALTGYAGVQTDYAEAAAVHPVEDRHHWMVVEDYQELLLTGFAGVQNEHAEAAAVHHV